MVRTMLKATLFVSFHMLLACLTMVYFTERDNPGRSIRVEYDSAARVSRGELVNVHGDGSWCDYSAFEKSVCTIVAFFSAAVCMVPIIVSSDSSMSRLDRDGLVPVPTWPERDQPTADGLRMTLFELTPASLFAPPYRPNLAYHMFRAASSTHTMVSTILAIFLSLSWFDPGGTNFTVWCSHPLTAKRTCYVIDIICVIWFTMGLTTRVLILYWKYFLSIQAPSHVKFETISVGNLASRGISSLTQKTSQGSDS